MTEATCRRELELEIPAEDVQKAVERVAREFARVARVPGFRPGKAPVTLIRRRFAEDIKSEVLQSLVPNQIERAVSENKMVPVTQPQIDKVDFAETGPVKFRATFEVLPEFDLGQYKDLEVEIEDVKIEDADVDKALEELRDRVVAVYPRIVEAEPHYFRIQRDTRFAKDKTPYKTNIAADLAIRARREGENEHGIPGMYFSFGLDGEYLGIGAWHNDHCF